MSNRTTRHFVALGAALLLVTTACGADGNDESEAEAAAATTSPVAPTASSVEDEPVAAGTVEANGEVVDVVALDNTFRPETIEISAGTAIRWENRGRNDHDVVPADETLEWGVDADGFAPGDEYTLLFDTPGEFPYFCSIHGTKDVGMIGTVVVLPADS